MNADNGSRSAVEVAQALMQRTLAGDIEGACELYAEDAVCWRNFDERELDKAQVARVIGFLRRLDDLRYEQVRISATDEGFVQQHVMRCRAASGADVRVAACLVAQVRDGLIRRLDEYVDSKAMAALL